jgi:protein disulfide-isomerase
MKNRPRSIVAAVACSFLLIAAADKSKPLYPDPRMARASLSAALKVAHEQNRLVIVVFGANWCESANELADLLTNDASVRKALAERYVLTYVNVGDDFEENEDLAEALGVEDLPDPGIPMLVILDANARVIAIKDPDDFAVPGKSYSPGALVKFLKGLGGRAKP